MQEEAGSQFAHVLDEALAFQRELEASLADRDYDVHSAASTIMKSATERARKYGAEFSLPLAEVLRAHLRTFTTGRSFDKWLQLEHRGTWYSSTRLGLFLLLETLVTTLLQTSLSCVRVLLQLLQYCIITVVLYIMTNEKLIKLLLYVCTVSYIMSVLIVCNMYDYKLEDYFEVPYINEYIRVHYQTCIFIDILVQVKYLNQFHTVF